MSKLKIHKKISLSVIDPDGGTWNNCYIIARPYGIQELRRISDSKPKDENDTDAADLALDTVIETVGAAFVEGKGLAEDDTLVELTRDDVQSLPVAAIVHINKELMGTPSPN